MIHNVNQKPCSPSFGAYVDPKFMSAADAFFKNKRNTKQYEQFCSAVRRFEDLPNSDNFTIKYSNGYRNGKAVHTLYAQEAGKGRIILSQKDMLRKLFDKFSFMNEYEFKVKTGMIKKD